jgi:hypothetical protein
MTASATLFAAGVICLALSGFMLYYTVPREGRPPTTVWTRTETRAMGTAMLFLLLFFSGIIMVLKAIF